MKMCLDSGSQPADRPEFMMQFCDTKDIISEIYYNPSLKNANHYVNDQAWFVICTLKSVQDLQAQSRVQVLATTRCKCAIEVNQSIPISHLFHDCSSSIAFRNNRKLFYVKRSDEPALCFLPSTKQQTES